MKSLLPGTVRTLTLALAEITNTAHAAKYKVTDFGTLGGTGSRAYRINNARQIMPANNWNRP